jgi:hypothetical protein
MRHSYVKGNREMRQTARIRVVLLAAFIVAGLTFPAAAEEGGKLKRKVLRVLQANSEGKCPEELLSPVLHDQCEQQIERIQARLQGLGSFDEAQYKGIEQLPNGTEAEVYKVIFEKGHMLWMATEGQNGKLNFLWSPG